MNVVRPVPNLISSKVGIDVNAAPPIVVTLSGITIFFNFEAVNAFESIVSNESGRVISVIPVL